MSEARCAVCERPLVPGEWVYATRRHHKWVHGGCRTCTARPLLAGSSPLEVESGRRQILPGPDPGSAGVASAQAEAMNTAVLIPFTPAVYGFRMATWPGNTLFADARMREHEHFDHAVGGRFGRHG